MKSPVSQTRSFSTVFLIEMWERFGYYGMAALLVLFIGAIGASMTRVAIALASSNTKHKTRRRK